MLSRPSRFLDRRLPLHRGQSLHPAPASITRGYALRGINKGSSNSPVRSSPRLRPPGWNEPPLRLSPELRTPPTRSRTTHVEVGTGQRARARNYTLNITSGLILQSVVHSLRATSRRNAHCETGCAGSKMPVARRMQVLLGRRADSHALLFLAHTGHRAGAPLFSATGSAAVDITSDAGRQSCRSGQEPPH